MTKQTLRHDHPAIAPGALRIISRLHEAGYEAFLVGGAVRDLVLGIPPKDYDIATDAPIDRIQELFDRTEPVGAAFGVCLVICDGTPYEVARFRTDGPSLDGRHPVSVSPADPREDALRRDFTINALLYDIRSDQVIDYIGGLDDLKTRQIRAVGDPVIRFSEDRLRMLRAIRFAARFDFRIEKKTAAAIADAAAMVLEVSPERIGQELHSMFSGPGAGRALSLLDQTGLLGAVIPEVAALQGVPQPPQFHPEGDVFTHTRLMLDRFDHGEATLGMGILLHDIGKPLTLTRTDRIRFHNHDRIGAEMATEILRRYRFPGAFIERVRYLVGMHMLFVNVPGMRQATLRRHLGTDGFEELLELYRLDCEASHGDLNTYEYVRERLNRERNDHDGPAMLPDPLLDGDDLIDLGYAPGPAFKEMLDHVYDMQLEGRVMTRDEAVRAVREAYPAEEE